MDVLITGGAGFIGANFVHFLRRVRPSWNISVIDLLTYAGNLSNISSLIDEDKITFIKGDISDSFFIDSIMADSTFDFVFNFAAESHVDRSIHSAASFVKTNVLGTQNLVDAARAKKVKRFIQISTDEVYGSLGPTGYFYENTPLDPTSPYAASKAASDLVALAAFKTHGFDLVLTRCTNNYGPYQFPEKLIPLFVTNALEDKSLPLYGDGMNVRSWLHVDDHCSAVLSVAEKGKAGEVYNVGSGPEGELPNVQVTDLILKKLNKPKSLIKQVADRLAHDKRYAVDFTKINKELGWSPTVRFEVGLSETVDWYVNNQNWWKQIKSGEYIKFYDKNYSQRLAI
ncbi:MAG: dTDP-glucose 4,6-dehydratase [bacterium]|nr:dTDP-glucose 4,6-dehydratase [bacterium]